jgi:plastocyanin
MRTLLAIAALALGAAACGSSDDGAASGPVCTTPPPTFVTTIVVTDFQFNPACAKVQAGAPITIQNGGGLPHSLTDAGAVPPTFDVQLPNPGTSATHTFAAPGTVRAFCTFHPTMRATIFVQ